MVQHGLISLLHTRLSLAFFLVRNVLIAWRVVLRCMEKPESRIRNRKRKRNRNRNQNWNRILNWDQGKLGSTETSSDTRVEIKFTMASSVIIVLRNSQHSDRDTKDILTFGKWLANKKGKCILLLFLAVTNCDCCSRSSNFQQIETTTNQKPIDCEKQPLLVCDV